MPLIAEIFKSEHCFSPRVRERERERETERERESEREREREREYTIIINNHD